MISLLISRLEYEENFGMKLFCLVFGEPIEYAFAVKVDKHETISELKEIIKEKKPNTFNDVDANELILWKINISLDELSQITHKNGPSTDIKSTLNGEQLLPLTKIDKAFPNEPVDEHIHVIVQYNKHSEESKALTSIVDKIKEIETKLDSMRTSLGVDNLRAETISCKFIMISDHEQRERWQIGYESSSALVFRDCHGDGDKRYAMFNDRYVDI
ncbi:hypothetical protein GLOIN_2v1844131 [Rhizophagus clarus]|uniref:Crinkler effector protein N-terminal domain-containing protein n=1 Tax=Rhizophagus clarus TaxID=94130 RepID=A0A8H3LRJ5_9GLOM|nr:hypothetical protein GLOIN_2v1844131 [Rhizophagus clarus]